MTEPVKHPKISVAMATFNGERFLEAQIESILKQEHPVAEIVVCDDRSDDQTGKILEEHHRQGVLKYFVNDVRLGVIANFRKAVSLTNPDHYVALSDQDDIWLPEKIKILQKELVKIDNGKIPAIVYSDMVVVDGDGQVINPSLWNEMSADTYQRSFETLLYGNFVHGCTVLMNQAMRKLFVESTAVELIHDYLIALIAYSFGKVSALPIPLVKYRKHGENYSYSPEHRKLHRWERRYRNMLKLVLGDRRYLEHEIETAQTFLQTYFSRLTPEQHQAISRIIGLQGKPFFWKKAVFHRVFRRYWK